MGGGWGIGGYSTRTESEVGRDGTVRKGGDFMDGIL